MLQQYTLQVYLAHLGEQNGVSDKAWRWSDRNTPGQVLVPLYDYILILHKNCLRGIQVCS